MSAEYAARMEVLQRRREELTAQRQAVEKRMALREATAAEFSAVALQSCRQKWKAQRSAAIAAQKRNDDFVRSVREAQRQVHDACAKLQGDQSRSGALLAQEKARYNRRIEQVYPAWQEQLQRQRVQKLRELEDKKRAVERRRYLAKKSFEKEQTLDDLIRKTRHEVEMAENLEQNELYERELLRTQSTNQAKEVDQSIREVALEARSHLQQQAAKHLEIRPEIDEELVDKLSETFSPRNTLRALREGGSSLAFEESQQYEEEKPARQIRVEIPARMNTPAQFYYPGINQQRSNQVFYTDNGEFHDEYVEEVAREFDDRPAYSVSMSTERHQVSATRHAGNDYTAFEQIINSHEPGFVAQRDQPAIVPAAAAPRSVDTVRGTEQQRTESSNSGRHHDQIELPRQPVDVLPTLVTGRLEPIPEATEKIPSDADSLNGRESASAGGGNSAISSFAAQTRAPTAAEDAPSTKVQENRVASSPATLNTAASVVDSFRSPVEIQVPGERYAVPMAPEPDIKDVPAPPNLTATSSLESKEVFMASSDISENTTIIPDAKPAGESLGKLAADEEPDEGPAANHETSLSAEGDDDTASSVGDVSVPTQPETESHVALTSEVVFKTKAANAESMDAKQTIAVVPRASLISELEADQTIEEGRGHDEPRGLDSFHRTNIISATVDTSMSTGTATPTLDVLENSPVHEEEMNTNDHVPTKLPESLPAPIAYATDLLEPFSPAASTPVNAQLTENDMMLASMQSDDFNFAATNSEKRIEEPADIEDKPDIVDAMEAVESVEAHTSPAETSAPATALEETSSTSITEKLSPVDRVKALGALISRVEEGATEGDTLSGSTDTGSSNESKRDLLKMAVGGRKAQIAFFGSDICFELILDISRDLGPVLFPPKSFEGIMNDQKLRKLHQSNKEKQLDLWKALSGHLKQLVQLKAISSAALVDLFVAAFLAHDPDNQRSQRKLREFLGTVCGGGGGGSGSRTPSPRKETSRASPSPSPPKQEQRSSSPEPSKPTDSDDRIGTPQLLQTAFLQRQSPPKPKVFGIASSSSFKDRSSGSSDVLASMSAGPMKLSQKLMRGGKMNDYSEFEEEEEVDLQNLIGTKSSASSSIGRSSYQTTKTSTAGNSAAKKAAAAVEEDDDSFDADF